MVSWSDNVNTDAYECNGSYEDNYIETEFECGKSRRWLKNSKPFKIVSFIIDMEDDGTSTSEFALFLDWYENTLKSGANSFSFPDIQTHSSLKEYRLTAVPTWEGQGVKSVSFSAQEC